MAARDMGLKWVKENAENTLDSTLAMKLPPYHTPKWKDFIWKVTSLNLDNFQVQNSTE